MKKITVKHFLNTNLKPYIINGEKYYSVYLMVIADRQNTKLKSYAFNEYYSESDFDEILSSVNEEDALLIHNEIETITKLVSMLIDSIEIFDTSLFSAIYNFFPSIFVFELDLDASPIFEVDGVKCKVDLYNKDYNKLHIAIDQFFIYDFSLKENNKHGMSIYTYFSPKGQSELQSFLTTNSVNIDIDEAIEYLNKLVFFKSLEKLSWILRGSNKYEKLLDKYDNLFSLTNEIYCEPIYKQIGVPVPVVEYEILTDPDTGEIYNIPKK